MSIKRGDIYWITKNPCQPTAGSVQEPGRPGIVVSNDANNACALTLEIVYLTCKQKKPLPTHCAIESTGKPSIALCEQVQTISDEQIREYIGHCTEEEMAELDRCIAISLGLTEVDDKYKKATPESPIFSNEEIADMFNRLTQAEKDLTASNARADLLQEMYNNLLERTMAG